GHVSRVPDVLAGPRRRRADARRAGDVGGGRAVRRPQPHGVLHRRAAPAPRQAHRARAPGRAHGAGRAGVRHARRRAVPRRRGRRLPALRGGRRVRRPGGGGRRQGGVVPARGGRPGRLRAHHGRGRRHGDGHLPRDRVAQARPV
ncbi:MAG: Succinyl-CoA synthetase, alpha subunit-related enzymes, partial [uncultured Nocardioides sp.]